MTFRNQSARHAECIPSPRPDRMFQVASEKVPLPSGREGADGGLVPPVTPQRREASRRPAGGGVCRRLPRDRWTRGQTSIVPSVGGRCNHGGPPAAVRRRLLLIPRARRPWWARRLPGYEPVLCIDCARDGRSTAREAALVRPIARRWRAGSRNTIWGKSLWQRRTKREHMAGGIAAHAHGVAAAELCRWDWEGERGWERRDRGWGGSAIRTRHRRVAD